MRRPKLVAIAVVTALLIWWQSGRPISPEDAPLMATRMGQLGGYLSALIMATLIVIISCWIYEGVMYAVRRARR